MTGTTVMIIHSGLLPDSMKDSISFSRLASFFGFSSEVDSAISTRRSAAIFSRSIADQHVADGLGADLGGEASSPNSSCASRYSSSLRSWRSLSGVRPGSVTT